MALAAQSSTAPQIKCNNSSEATEQANLSTMFLPEWGSLAHGLPYGPVISAQDLVFSNRHSPERTMSDWLKILVLYTWKGRRRGHCCNNRHGHVTIIRNRHGLLHCVLLSTLGFIVLAQSGYRASTTCIDSIKALHNQNNTSISFIHEYFG